MTKKSLSHDFDYIAPYYDRGLRILLFALGTEARLRKRIASALKCESLKKDARILEIGCGTGSNLLAIDKGCPRCYQLTGVDLSIPMLEQARKKKFTSKVEFVQGDASEKLPFADESFESVLVVFTLHEIPEEGRAKAVSEMYRLLKRGGCALVADLSRPDNFWERIPFSFLRLIESKEALKFAREGPDPLFLRCNFRKESEESLLFGITKISLYRKG